jgi:hypothetical protein
MRMVDEQEEDRQSEEESERVWKEEASMSGMLWSGCEREHVVFGHTCSGRPPPPDL